MNQRQSLTALTATLSLLLAVPALATEPGAVRTAQAGDVVLQYRPSELATSEGRARTYTRLQSAAAQVCARYEDRELARQLVHQRCVDRLLTAAVLDIHDAGLLALHQASRGGHVNGGAATPIRTARR